VRSELCEISAARGAAYLRGAGPRGEIWPHLDASGGEDRPRSTHDHTRSAAGAGVRAALDGPVDARTLTQLLPMTIASTTRKEYP